MIALSGSLQFLNQRSVLWEGRGGAGGELLSGDGIRGRVQITEDLKMFECQETEEVVSWEMIFQER